MKKLLLAICLFLVVFISTAQTAKVVGYMPTYRFSLSGQIEYCKLTHLNLCFANPDSDGNLVMPNISGVMSDAVNDNPAIVICISLGGGALSTQQKENWSNLIDIPTNRPAFISKIVDYVLDNNLHGVDMDLEWGDVTSGYSNFILELDAALNANNKLLTVAFPNLTLYSNVTKAALNAFDFINIMSYDATGPWNPSQPGQHSSYSFAQNGIYFWKNTGGIPGNKLTLGVPFYGYDFISSTNVSAFTFSTMVAKNASYADIDNVGNAYYNGRSTIEKKVKLAKDEVAGIMIWELGQDSYDEYSLLNTIHKQYTSLGITTTGLCGNEATALNTEIEKEEKIIIYPNPTSKTLTVKYKSVNELNIRIINSLGITMPVEKTINGENELYFDVSMFPKGMYFVSVFNNNKVLFADKIIVQ